MVSYMSFPEQSSDSSIMETTSPLSAVFNIKQPSLLVFEWFLPVLDNPGYLDMKGQLNLRDNNILYTLFSAYLTWDNDTTLTLPHTTKIGFFRGSFPLVQASALMRKAGVIRSKACTACHPYNPLLLAYRPDILAISSSTRHLLQ